MWAWVGVPVSVGGCICVGMGGCACVGVSHLMIVPIAPPLEVVMTRETRALWRSSSSSFSILHAREKERAELRDMVLISSGRGKGGITPRQKTDTQERDRHTHRQTCQL